MKQSLELRLGQQLTLTPQLQQAIYLLQLSSVDLEAEIQKALDDNLMLELHEENTNEKIEEQWNHHEETTITTQESTWEQEINLEQTTMPSELPVDSVWEDVYPNTFTSNHHAIALDSDMETQHSQQETLQQHLEWQLNMSSLTDQELLIAQTLIESIDNRGFLSASLEDIAASLPAEANITLSQIATVLSHIQQFDPAGVGARDLKECLLIQLRQLPPETPWLKEASYLLEHHMDLLGKRQYKKLMQRQNWTEQTLQHILKFIQTLNPHPGHQLFSIPTSYIIPDVIVKKQHNRWTVELNDTTPRLRINHNYAALVQRGNAGTDNVFLRNHLQEARWFLKSLKSRHDTLLKVAHCIVEQQRDFLELGEKAMKPLVLHDVAKIVGMHESTISRITTQKYMHTPKGVFELKYFFSSHVSTDTGGECSSTAIRALIKKAISVENPKSPLSDHKIARLLNDQGICVARRTVAKYREALAIPASNQRKNFF